MDLLLLFVGRHLSVARTRTSRLVWSGASLRVIVLVPFDPMIFLHRYLDPESKALYQRRLVRDESFYFKLSSVQVISIIMPPTLGVPTCRPPLNCDMKSLIAFSSYFSVQPPDVGAWSGTPPNVSYPV